MGNKENQKKKDKKTKRKPFIRALKDELKRKKGIGTLYIVLRVFVIASLVFEIVNKRYENAALCVLTLALFLLPTFVEDTFKVDFPNLMEVVILLFTL